MMKAKHYLLGAALSLLAMGQTMAQHLSPEQARANAEAFLQQQTGLRSTSEFQLSFAVSDTMQLDAGATLRSASGSGDALLYAFKIADAERRGDGVKTVILVGQGGAVLPLEGDMG